MKLAKTLGSGDVRKFLKKCKKTSENLKNFSQKFVTNSEEVLRKI